MKNSQLGKIAMSTAVRPRARFNLSHDFNTTAAWGDTQPMVCRLLTPDSTTALDVESLVRLAPMPAPTFGRVKFKQWHTFVPMSAISKNFERLLSQTPISNGSHIFQPTSVPHIRLGLLSALPLIGAKVTIYDMTGDDQNDATDVKLYKAMSPTIADKAQQLWNALDMDNYYHQQTDISYFSNYRGPAINLSRFLPVSSQVGNVWIPVSNVSSATFFEMPQSVVEQISKLQGRFNYETVPLDTADMLVTRNVNGHWVTYAFRFSSFGKRLRKILLGLGYSMDLESTQEVSFMPLLAYFLAYYNIFGLCLYENFDTTWMAKLMTRSDWENQVDFSQLFVSGNYEFWHFIDDLGNTWVTAGQDYVSAHIGSTAVSPSVQPLNAEFVDVDGAPHIQHAPNQEGNYVNGHSFINDVLHGHLDSEYLKRLYRWTNRNTIAGRRIAELLRAQGLGTFVDRCKSDFIGYAEKIVTISDVTSTSDTYSDGKGSLLGEYAGRGLGYDKSKTFTLRNGEFGFWIGICAIVPESGYCQALDGSLLCTKKFDFFNPEFDGLGYEATRKNQVVGSQDWSTPVGSKLTETFGLVPRYSHLKVASNVMSGDFACRGTRNNYRPYTLDKIIDLGERAVALMSETADTKTFTIQKLMQVKHLPAASNVWRYVARYPWLGMFNRIFANVGQQVEASPVYAVTVEQGHTLFEYIANEYDNFMLHNILNFRTFARMLPIEQSFETDDGEGHTNTAMEKA